jgi:hypothetical protein
MISSFKQKKSLSGTFSKRFLQGAKEWTLLRGAVCVPQAQRNLLNPFAPMG